MALAILFVALIVILIGAEAFTNALEHLGQRLRISEGVTGSIFAAVGTALPETMVPIVAIFSSTSTQQIREEVGVGAILGAPLMLSTVAIFLMAVFAARRRGWSGHFRPERTGLSRDLSWFLVAFGLATVAIFVPREWMWLRIAIALVLVVQYFLYLMVTIRASNRLVNDGHATQADQPLYLARVMRRPDHDGWPLIVFQLAAGFGLIFAGARGFVHGVESLSALLGMSALLLSLVIIPIATELPEKVNSILWIRRGRDTLAFGNITGAMVFQGSLLPAIGITLTPWEPRAEVVAGVLITLAAAAFLYWQLRRGTLRPYHALVNGAAYLAYFGLVWGVESADWIPL